jgi:hypothetical protein
MDYVWRKVVQQLAEVLFNGQVKEAYVIAAIVF